MKRRDILKAGLAGASLALELPLLSGCGGGGGDDPSPAPNPQITPACTRPTFSMGMAFASQADLQAVAAAPRISIPSSNPLPATFDNSADLSDFGYRSGLIPPVGNQGQQGSCVAWGTGYAMASSMSSLFNRTLPNTAASQASPADLYAKLMLRERNSCGNGTYVRDALDILVTEGIASNLDVPYSDKVCYAPSNARLFTIHGYSKIDPKDILSIRDALFFQQLLPFGMQVYPDFQNFTGPAGKGVYSHPASDTSCSLGGHCMVVTGYDDNRNAFKIMNSWGASEWGDNGFGWIAYETFSRIVNEVYAPYLYFDNTFFPNTLIPTASATSAGVQVIKARAYPTFSYRDPKNSLAFDFLLSDAIRVTSYGIHYPNSDPSKAITFGTAKIDQWVKGASYTFAVNDPQVQSLIRVRDTVIAASIQGLSRTGEQVTLVAYANSIGGR
ncbi:C1 family peptidase [Cupriavidus sp. GA3-3]|uniref:C1 family peptidase n=1 Tax=Cupriavidus sp. GA3-3 TaxID=1229514 RepID=UPI00039C38F2|nr:C1 family peptidase [Cupriavidus sp. GA3-3]